MRYTKSKKRFDGNGMMFYNPNQMQQQQMFQPQQQQMFQPQPVVQIEDQRGHIFNIQKDMFSDHLAISCKIYKP